MPNSIAVSTSRSFDAFTSASSDMIDSNPVRHIAQESSSWTSFVVKVGSWSIASRMRSKVVIGTPGTSPPTMSMAVENDEHDSTGLLIQDLTTR